MRLQIAPFAFKSTSTSAALAVTATIMLFPANLLPVLTTAANGKTRSDTIASGAVELWQQGLWGIALVVITASIVIPILKLACLGWLLLCTCRPGMANPRRLTRVYSAIDFIGRWSMLDVFLVAFLTGLVKFGELSTVIPRSGIVAFASVVVLTVLATQAFDPRLIWRHTAPSL